jgi:hypothetical protein
MPPPGAAWSRPHVEGEVEGAYRDEEPELPDAAWSRAHVERGLRPRHATGDARSLRPAANPASLRGRTAPAHVGLLRRQAPCRHPMRSSGQGRRRPPGLMRALAMASAKPGAATARRAARQMALDALGWRAACEGLVSPTAGERSGKAHDATSTRNEKCAFDSACSLTSSRHSNRRRGGRSRARA